MQRYEKNRTFANFFGIYGLSFCFFVSVTETIHHKMTPHLLVYPTAFLPIIERLAGDYTVTDQLLFPAEEVGFEGIIALVAE